MAQDERARLAQAQIDTNKKMATWTMVVGIFTTVLAVVSIITGGFIWWQASTAAQVARDTREQLRAAMQFIGVQTLSGPVADGSQVYGFLSNFQNFGGTRADNLKGWQSVSYFAGTVPYNTDLSKPKNVLEAAISNIVGPNTTITFAPVTLKASEVESALKKEGVIVLWGRLSYNDIYEAKTEHLITVCQTLTPTQATGSPLISFGFTPFRGDCNTSK